MDNNIAILIKIFESFEEVIEEIRYDTRAFSQIHRLI